MKLISRIILLALLIPVALQGNSPETKIVLLHTNDVHGEISNISKVAALKQELMAKYDTVLLLSAGDMFSGNPYIDFYEEKGYPMVELMNMAGYDLAVLGNHEFDYGQEVLKERMEQANFAFIATNADASGADLSEYIETHYQVSINGIVLEFHGLIETENNGKPSTHPAKVEGIEFKNPLEYIKQIKKSVNADYALLLNHLGFENDSIIASNFQDFPVIIGGHSHTIVDSIRFINDVLVAQSGENLENVGMVELTFRDGELVNRDYKLINLSTYSNKDSNITAKTNEFLTNPELGTPLGKVVSPFENMYELGCLFTDAQRSVHSLDFAFQNYWGIRIKEVPVGDFTKAMVYELDPFGNDLVIFSMTKEEMESLIVNAFKFTGRTDMLISGGSYTIKADDNNNFVSIKLVDTSGKELEPGKKYKVGINSYIVDSYKFNHSCNGTNSATTTANNLIEHIKSVKELDYNGCQRVFVERE